MTAIKNYAFNVLFSDFLKLQVYSKKNRQGCLSIGPCEAVLGNFYCSPQPTLSSVFICNVQVFRLNGHFSCNVAQHSVLTGIDNVMWLAIYDTVPMMLYWVILCHSNSFHYSVLDDNGCQVHVLRCFSPLTLDLMMGWDAM